MDRCRALLLSRETVHGTAEHFPPKRLLTAFCLSCSPSAELQFCGCGMWAEFGGPRSATGTVTIPPPCHPCQLQEAMGQVGTSTFLSPRNRMSFSVKASKFATLPKACFGLELFILLQTNHSPSLLLLPALCQGSVKRCLNSGEEVKICMLMFLVDSS